MGNSDVDIVYYRILTAVGSRFYPGLQLFVCPEEVGFKFGPCFRIVGFVVPLLDVIGEYACIVQYHDNLGGNHLIHDVLLARSCEISTLFQLSISMGGSDVYTVIMVT